MWTEENHNKIQGLLGPDYQIIRYLGEGSFYSVWDAFDSLKRPWIVKWALDRVHLKAELEAYKKLTEQSVLVHPYIAYVHEVRNVQTDIGVIETFVIMEHAKYSLEQMIRSHPDYFSKPENIYRLLTHTVKGLEPFHKIQRVHRDVHPGNILYFEEDFFKEKDIFKITDLGLVSRTGRLTKGTRGLPSYTAPEVAKGKVDPRSDIYSIGAVLYTILNKGRPMFLHQSGETEQKKEKWDEFVKPTIDDNIKDELFRKILYRCLHPKQDKRYNEGSEILDALGRPINVSSNLNYWVNELSKFIDKKTVDGTLSTTNVKQIRNTRVTLENYVRAEGLDSDENVKEQLDRIDEMIFDYRKVDYTVVWAWAGSGEGDRNKVRRQLLVKSGIKPGELNNVSRFAKLWNKYRKENKGKIALYRELCDSEYWDFNHCGANPGNKRRMRKDWQMFIDNLLADV